MSYIAHLGEIEIKKVLTSSEQLVPRVFLNMVHDRKSDKGITILFEACRRTVASCSDLNTYSSVVNVQ